MSFVLGLILGLQVGYYAWLIKKWVQELGKTPPSTGVTRGAYNEPHTRGRTVSGSVISPKSPQQVAFEASEDLKRMSNR